ncbi:hypothetical protein C8J57DRAFT_1069201 [Mycena rebaudengoi]|nr:hypothetical protein C8J57DRAFT_1069201 [Mycena rebaudengoi]
MTADNDQQGVNHAPAPASTAAAPLQDTAGSSGDADVLMADVPAATIFPPPPSSLVPCPAKAAEWFCHARLELTRRDLGPHFAAILNAWTRIEAASRFEHSESNLPHKGRPAQVGRWTAAQRRARPADISITDLAKYAVQWRAWWGSLQPVWRSKGVDGQWDIGGSYGSEWGDLFQWGVNGVLSLLAALYFWGCAVLDVPEANEAQVWELEVQDVGWMLEGLAVYYERKDWKF